MAALKTIDKKQKVFPMNTTQIKTCRRKKEATALPINVITADSEGKMDILAEEVIGHRWEGNSLDPTYSEYEINLFGFIYADAQDIPF